MSETRTALIVGATGVSGRNLLEHLLSEGGWNIIAVSRRKPDAPGAYTHIAADLLDPADCRTKLGRDLGLTHIFYTAYLEKPVFAEMGPPNLAMLKNLMDAVEPVSPKLENVHLMHGTKWYGSHLGPFKTPAKENDARLSSPNFYYDQMDFIVARQKGKRWNWSSARPHAICGFAIGNPMNLVMTIAVYAALLKEQGLPLRSPGTLANYQSLYQVTDSKLLARAMTWMATDKNCANESFNITNGDIFRWQYMWPVFADYFGMELACPQNISLANVMADKAPLWDRIVGKYGLQNIPYEQAISWRYGDLVFAAEHDIVSSTTKARAHGFQDCIDSEQMFRNLFDELRRRKIIPSPK